MIKSDKGAEFKQTIKGKPSDFHKPVLLKETIGYLRVQEDKWYIDATLGGGGYTFAILEQGGKVLGIDLDQDAISFVRSKIKNQKSKIKLNEDLVLVQGNFKDIDEIAHLNKLGKVAGITFDLGFSSYQIEKSGRGFSFLRDEPLDMRMDISAGSNNLTAFDIVNFWTKEELYELFSKMGEERFFQAISDNIVSARKITPIKSSLHLEKIISEVVHETRKTHPATKVFQALRIAVNNEIVNLREGTRKGFDVLESGGRMAIVSFHSLEDRIVKNSFNEYEDSGKAKIITKRPITASYEEQKSNSRSRSAKLRVIEKL